MSRRARTFDEQLEGLLDVATPDQLQRIHDLSGFLLRRECLAKLPPAPKPRKAKPEETQA